MKTNKVVRLLLLTGLTVISASTVQGQRVENIGLTARGDSARPTSVRVAQRLFGSAGGAAAGLVGGVLIASQFPAHNCGCDDPGLTEAIYGALTGVTLGAALGAATPGLHSVCSFGGRFGRSLLGAGLGTAAGAFTTIASGNLVFVPIGAVVGSLTALGPCWKSR